MISSALRPSALLVCGWIALKGLAIAQEEVHYAFGPETTLTYRVNHPIHGATGVSHELQGTIAALLGDRPKLVLPLTLSVPLQSFDSGNGNRDRNMLATMNAARYPAATLALTAVSWSSQRVEAGAVTVAGTARGTLTLHGVQQAVEIPIAGHADSERLEVTSKFSVLLSRYGVERPSLLFRPIDDEVPIEVTAIAHRQ